MANLKLACVLLLCTTPFCWSEVHSGQNSSVQNSSAAQNTSDQNSAVDQNAQGNQTSADQGAQQPNSTEPNPLRAITESTKAVDYRQGSKSEIDFKGTNLMPEATGTAHVQTKSGTTQIDAKLEHLQPANSLGLQYLTYVLWGISPEGVPSNLGELIVKDGKSEVHASTPMQAFALIVTAEPYFAVTQPNEKVVAENEPGTNAQGFIRPVDVHYQALPAGTYSSQVKPIQEPVYGIDKKIPLSLKEARNAVRIAQDAHADQYANAPLQRAQQLLSQADDYYNRKQNDKSITTVAREATQAAEAARVMAIKGEQQAKIERRQREADEKAAKAQADAQAQAQQAQEAQVKAQQAESARQNAEQQAAQAAQAAQQAAQAAQTAQQQLQQQASSGQQIQADQQAAAQQAQQQAQQAQQQAAAAQQRAQEQERAAQLAQQQLQQQQAAAAAAQQQLQQEQAARQQAEQQAQSSQQQLQQTRQQLSQAQTDKEQMRQRLLDQLNQVLQTKDSARGLIVNMPDVLFNLNSANLKPNARERLAKVAGILIAYPDIHVEVDGYTDNTGSLDYNQQLSQQRADTVRSYLVQQGVPSSSIESKGFGPNDPVASNDTPQGRQQNRRVDLVVSGQSIGAHMTLPDGNQ